ncbi:MAG: LacI family DNA-binding transcriptional regulator [Armatimonadetes bacterium]|nr:LacI family DNA-binding transcriptional regulator [Armatimonadota bacterium]
MPHKKTDSAPLPRRARHSDVAKRAGVSPATVSKVMTGRESDRISEETRERVLAVVSELNYVPRSAVREMQTGRTGRIGVLLTHPAAFGNMDPYHLGILSGILSKAFDYRRNTLLYTALEPGADTLRQELLGGGADAVIAVGNVWTPLVEEVVTRANLPVVYVSVLPGEATTPRSVPYFGVDCDNEAGGRLGITHLTDLGHRRIAVIRGRVASNASFVQERIAGAMATADEATANLELVEYKAMEEVIKRVADGAPDAPSAFFFIEGENILGELYDDFLPRYGLSVPRDLSIVTFNSTMMSEYASVPTTSVRQPLQEIGETAVRILAEFLAAGASADHGRRTVVRLPVSLEIRASTAPVNR